MLAGALLLAPPLGAQPAAVPPPVEQLTADCRNPVYATDRLVCADPQLRALDSRMAEVLLNIAEPPESWRDGQRQWFLARSRCAFAEDHRRCAETAYRTRLAQLGAGDSPPSDPGGKPCRTKAAKCPHSKENDT